MVVKVKAKIAANQSLVEGLIASRVRYPQGHNMLFSINKAIKSVRVCDHVVDTTAKAEALHAVGGVLARMMMKYRRETPIEDLDVLGDFDALAEAAKAKGKASKNHGFQAGKGPWCLLMTLFMAGGEGTREDMSRQLTRLRRIMQVDAKVHEAEEKWWSSSRKTLQTKALCVNAAGGAADAWGVSSSMAVTRLTEHGRVVAEEVASQFGFDKVPKPTGWTSFVTDGSGSAGGDGSAPGPMPRSLSSSSSSSSSAPTSVVAAAPPPRLPPRQSAAEAFGVGSNTSLPSRAAAAAAAAAQESMVTLISLLTPSPDRRERPDPPTPTSHRRVRELVVAVEAAEANGGLSPAMTPPRDAFPSASPAVSAPASLSASQPDATPSSCFVDLTQVSSEGPSQTSPPTPLEDRLSQGPSQSQEHGHGQKASSAPHADVYSLDLTQATSSTHASQSSCCSQAGSQDTTLPLPSSSVAAVAATAASRGRNSPCSPEPVLLSLVDDDDRHYHYHHTNGGIGGQNEYAEPMVVEGDKEGEETQVDSQLQWEQEKADGVAMESVPSSAVACAMGRTQAAESAGAESGEGEQESLLDRLTRRMEAASKSKSQSQAPSVPHTPSASQPPSQQQACEDLGDMLSGLERQASSSSSNGGGGNGGPDLGAYNGRKSLMVAVMSVESGDGLVLPQLPPLPHVTGGAHTSSSKRATLETVERWGYPLWQVLLLIDGREHKDGATFANHCDVPCAMATLGVGDFVWVAEHRVTGERRMLDCVVERKSVVDLAGSMVDGRYNDQRQRMYRCGARRRVYLVEGNLDSFSHGSITARSLKATLVNTYVEYGIQVLLTSSPKDTAEQLGLMTRHIESRYLRCGDLHRQDGPPGALSLEAFNAANKKKSSAATVQEALAYMLHQLPNLSPDSAHHLASHFGSLPGLVRALGAMPRKDAVHHVSTMQRAAKGLGAATEKRVGPVLATRLCELFLDDF